ncbi:unnamed protein product [Rhizoctonia solani]|uniref:Uncharacterized protein n=1 Tax=Rhizoctonia solani TaxID=456999 RepID=A0A8H3H7A8_9AGAM|nr:unnamed protein product [Rhizoctonia solani]
MNSDVEHMEKVECITDVRAGWLIRAQELIDILEELKTKLLEIKGKDYKRRFFYQQGIIRDLDNYERSFQEANREFSVYIASVSLKQVTERRTDGKIMATPYSRVAVILCFPVQDLFIILWSEYNLCNLTSS